ncbi:hypothetical protein [Streptomyces sp. NPDC017940]|uniref:hypothetical protein n=1 Tax=Streptomyces sp. NPDC017940 TaxID=3365017 RepID=UPI0037925D78
MPNTTTPASFLVARRDANADLRDASELLTGITQLVNQGLPGHSLTHLADVLEQLEQLLAACGKQLSAEEPVAADYYDLAAAVMRNVQQLLSR